MANMQSAIQKLEEFDRWGIFHRVILFFLNSLFLSTVPLYAFILYMAENGFFSYDVIVNSIFALNIFIVFSSIFFLFIAFFMCGSVVFLVASIGKNRKINWVRFTLFLVFLAFNIYAVYLVSKETVKADQTFEAIVFIMTLGFPLYVHIGLMFSASPKVQVISLFAVASILYVSLIGHIGLTNQLIGKGLFKFGVGGERPIVILETGNRNNVLSEGVLVFMSPENLYIKEGSSKTQLAIIERSESIIVVMPGSKQDSAAASITKQ